MKWPGSRVFRNQGAESLYEQKTYHQIVLLALGMHLSYVVVFALTGFWLASAYNVGSSVFYLGMLWLVRRRRYKAAVLAIHVEVWLFVTLCTVLIGWDAGLAMFLLAVSSLVYVCPFEHRVIPYLLSVAGFLVCFFLKLYMDSRGCCYPPLNGPARFWLFAYNMLLSFGLVIYAAFSSQVSANVTRKALQDENESLSELANYDQLTGLLSRYSFLRKLKTAAPQRVVALGDIDDFKRVNDVFGHNCGDEILSAVAELLRKTLGGGVEICRWGGEEIVFLFPETGPEQAREKLESLRRTVEGHVFRCGEQDLRITMTFGMAWGGPEADAQSLIEAADRRMYRGKEQGKNRVVA